MQKTYSGGGFEKSIKINICVGCGSDEFHLLCLMRIELFFQRSTRRTYLMMGDTLPNLPLAL